MKNISILLSLLLVLLWSCEDKFSSEDFLLYDIENIDTVNIPPISDIGKKGIAVPQIGNTWSARVSSVKPFWHISGASKISIKEPGNVDFVPMIKDTSDMGDETFSSLHKMNENGDLRYIVAFDEPDNPEKANMSVAEAIALWPELEQFAVPLSSPLCTDPNGEWMDEFMAAADQNDLRVDYVSVQWEGEDELDEFFGLLESTYAKYGKPLWVTNFTLVNTKLKDVISFLEVALPQLEQLDYVFRYSFLSGGINTGTALWDDLGNLTTRGQLYAAHVPNTFISNGRDDRIDISSLTNIIINGDFETGDLTGWDEGYGISVESGDANNGEFAGKGNVTGWGSSFNQIFEVEPLTTYYISFSCKFFEPITEPDWFLSGLAMTLKDNIVNEKFFDSGRINSTEWTTHAEQVTIPEGVTEIKMILWRPHKSPEYLLDDIFFAKVE